MKKQLTIFQYFSYENVWGQIHHWSGRRHHRDSSEEAVGLVVVQQLRGGCLFPCTMAGRERARRRLSLGLYDGYEEAVA
jgi:hypothetical protein